MIRFAAGKYVNHAEFIVSLLLFISLTILELC